MRSGASSRQKALPAACQARLEACTTRGNGTRSAGLQACLATIQVENRFDRPSADDAEGHVVAGEPDAVSLRAIGSACLVVGTLERPHLSGVRALIQQRGVLLFLVAEQR